MCRHRRQHALRQTLSGTLPRHGSASEMLSAMTAGHTPAASVSRRRRHSHRRSGSSGSVSALILSPIAPRPAVAPGAGSHTSPRTTVQATAAEASVAAEHGLPNGPHISEAQEVPAFYWDAARGGPADENGGDSCRQAAMVASNPTAAYGRSQTGESLSEPSEAGAWLASPSPTAGPAQLHLLPFQIYEASTPVDPAFTQPQLQDFRRSVPDGPNPAMLDLSTDQTQEPAPQPCNTGNDLPGVSTSALPTPGSPVPGTGIVPTTPGPFPGHNDRSHALGSTALPEPVSRGRTSSCAAPVAAQASPQSATMAQLQVKLSCGTRTLLRLLVPPGFVVLHRLFCGCLWSCHQP